MPRRPPASTAGTDLPVARAPVSGKLKNYCNYWSKHLKPQPDYPSYFAAGLIGRRLPAACARSPDGHYARLVGEFPPAGPADELIEQEHEAELMAEAIALS